MREMLKVSESILVYILHFYSEDCAVLNYIKLN